MVVNEYGVHVKSLREFMDKNWMTPSDIITDLLEICRERNSSFEVALAAGRFYDSMSRKYQETDSE